MLRDWLWPGRCLLCLVRLPWGRDLCERCEQSLPFISSCCKVCARPLPVGGTSPVCGQCQQSPPAYDSAHAVFRYTAPVSWLIQDLKYARRLDLARLFGTYLAETLAGRALSLPDRLIPVPLHRSRLRERGYNQSLELARPVARRLGLRLDAQAAERLRPTLPQAELSLEERRRNVRNAFRATTPLDGEHVAVLDDVMTSGLTVEALARCLKQAGAKTVSVWVVARA